MTKGFEEGAVVRLTDGREEAFVRVSEVGRKEIARMMGEVPNNVFRSYEVDLDDNLPRAQAEGILRRPGYYLALLEKEAVELAEEDAAVEEGGDGEDGDDWDDEGDDEFGDDDDEFGDDDDEGW